MYRHLTLRDATAASALVRAFLVALPRTYVTTTHANIISPPRSRAAYTTGLRTHTRTDTHWRGITHTHWLCSCRIAPAFTFALPLQRVQFVVPFANARLPGLRTCGLLAPRDPPPSLLLDSSCHDATTVSTACLCSFHARPTFTAALHYLCILV